MNLTLALLLSAAAIGMFLAVGVAAGRSNGWRIPLLHGLCGFAGLVALLVASRAAAPVRGLAGFRPAAAILLGIALLFGLRMLVVARRGGRPSGLAVGTHALIATGGIVMVLAIAALG